MFSWSCVISYRFSPVGVGWSLSLWRWNMIFSDTEMIELGIRHTTNIHNTRSMIRTLKYVSWTFCRRKKPSRWQNINTHTHTHTHTHTYILLANITIGRNANLFVHKRLIFFIGCTFRKENCFRKKIKHLKEENFRNYLLKPNKLLSLLKKDNK